MSFLYPFILSAFIVLPALYYLLKITPPAPKIVSLPTARFLAELKPQDTDTHATPWWILLLRLLMAALVILALSAPVLNPEPLELSSDKNTPVRVIVDNGWASAQTWDAQITAAKSVIDKAAQAGRSVIAFSTADEQTPETLISPAQAQSWLKSLEPRPWPADFKSLAQHDYQNADTFWFGHGLDDGGVDTLAKKLGDPLTYYKPSQKALPLAVTWNAEEQHAKILRVYSKDKQPPIIVQALNKNDSILDQKTLQPDAHIAEFDTDDAIAQIRILGRAGVGSFYKRNGVSDQKHIGVILPETSAQDTPFLTAGYYLRRALDEIVRQPEHIKFGSITAVIENAPDIIILPDTVNLPAEDLNALDTWVNAGGLLLQFAGANMATASPDQIALPPVRLRSGGRSLGGELTWDEPLNLKKPQDTSPLSVIHFHPTYSNIKVNRAVLAEPETDLAQKTWLSLSDGTPFITAAPVGNGLSILVHTTTTTQWSDFVLSGLYVEILNHLVSLSGKNFSAINTNSSGALNASWVWDGWGQKTEAPDTLDSLDTNKIITLSSALPPGLYEDQSGLSSRMINLGDTLTSLKPMNVANTETYDGQSTEHSLAPYLFLAATLLFLIDWIVMIGLPRLIRLNLKTAAAILAIFTPVQAYAETPLTDLYLGYIITGDLQTDATSAQGLNALSTELNRRTSANPVGVIGVNVNRDSLKPFPFLYWPMTAKPTTLSPEIRQKIQNYLNHGGTILFDTRGRARADHQNNLRAIMAGISVPALHAIPEDHVLRKSFYLLSEFPGVYRDDTLWVEQSTENGRDGVSSVIVGSHDWASAWAAYASGATSRNTDLAMRFGVNVTMYALTGNYKNDQLHVQEILKRMGAPSHGGTP